MSKIPHFRPNGRRMMEDCTTNDYYSLAYYLYCISEINEEIAFCSYQEIYRLFKTMAKEFGVAEKLNKFTEKSVLSAKKKGIFKSIPANERHLAFDGGRIKYEYEEDQDIDRLLSRGNSVPDKELINLYRCFYTVDNPNALFADIIANFLLRKKPCAKLIPLENIPAHIEQALNDTSSIDFIDGSLGLTDLERRFLVFLFRCELKSPIGKVAEDLTVGQLIEFRKKVLGIDTASYNSLVSAGGALRSFGFIDENGDLEDEAAESFANKSLDVFFADLLKDGDCSEAYDLASFGINRETNTVIQRMISGQENISVLLYGKAGSGKSEYAKSLVKASGMKPLVFKNEAELSVSRFSHENVLCRLNLLLSIPHPDSVLIIDEAETMLETSAEGIFGMRTASPKKAVVNKMLENSRNKIIWIVNHTAMIDKSTLRRFNFSCKFDAMSAEQLRKITAAKLEPLALESRIKSQILDLIDKYNITGASVDNVVKTIKSLGTSDPKQLVSSIRTILKENSALLTNGKPSMRRKLSPAYDMSALNTTVSPAQIVEMIENAENFSKSNRSVENGIRMLFYGLSGTGKTEFARYIADRLGKKILLKRASDILDRYVGGTEKLIRDAFAEAEKTNSILLLDEADSFFANREQAQYSWERTQVNELLTQMEEFNGIFICTTNLRKIIDPAMNRRFHIIVEFKPMTQDGIRCMLNSYFSSFCFTEEEVRRLERCSTVTPGDFGVLAQKIRFMNQSEIDHSFIIEELCRIQREKKNDSCSRNRIGYSA
ncbi:AAA family ATPase [bacterium]|nr:AAA family ATPase [bacterium]